MTSLKTVSSKPTTSRPHHLVININPSPSSGVLRDKSSEKRSQPELQTRNRHLQSSDKMPCQHQSIDHGTVSIFLIIVMINRKCWYFLPLGDGLFVYQIEIQLKSFERHNWQQ